MFRKYKLILHNNDEEALEFKIRKYFIGTQYIK
jgi:hypothetical protein